MTLDEFIEADFEEGWLYELARGVIDVTEVPGPNHGADRPAARRTLHPLRRCASRRSSTIGPAAANAASACPGCSRTATPTRPSTSVPDPEGPRPWTRWVPHIVVEVVSEGGEDRDYVEKREEYLRVGVLEYWILDPKRRRMLVLRRPGDVWEEVPLGEDGVHRTELLPGLEARVAELLGPIVEAPED